MFKKSEELQGDMFKSISGHLGIRKQKMLENPNSWHNIFYKEVIGRIDESPYSELYAKGLGRPNSSVRTMIAMMILKEGQGWSDEQMYEACRFDLKVMRALGLFHLDQDVPTESTYYEFRRLLQEYNERESHDLLRDTFADITTQQVKELRIGGKKIRMDSKLINSNIAKSTRLQLILEATRKYLNGHTLIAQEVLDPTITELLSKLQIQSASNISYGLSNEEKQQMLLQLGELIQYLLSLDVGAKDNADHILSRLYKEQYEEDGKDEDKPKPKPPKDISSGSIQSAHDPQAAYRSKGTGLSKQTVSGYHANIVESCDEKDVVNLILDVEVIPANICEDAFLEPGIDKSEQILQKAHQTSESQIKEAITDGGYDSIANRDEMLKEERPTWSMAKTKGGKRIYNFTKEEEGKIKVTHIPSGQKCEVTRTKDKGKYVIKNPGGNKRYMTSEEVENYIKRQAIESQTNTESYNLRANVESTIHQCFHRLKKRNKIVYRGQLKCQWYVISRALWANMTRIKDYKLEKAITMTIIRLRCTVTAIGIRNWKSKIFIHLYSSFQINA